MNAKSFLSGVFLAGALASGGLAWAHAERGDGDGHGMGMMSQMQGMMNQCSEMMERMGDHAGTDGAAGSPTHGSDSGTTGNN